MAARERLGRRTAFASREYVYRSQDCFEIDEIEGYEVTRKRVFFDDVVLVTRHTYRPWAPAILLAMIAGLFALTAFGMSAIPDNIAAAVTFVIGMLFLLLAVLLVSIGGDEVTIQGKRTMARMHFLMRKGRALEVYRLVCRLTRERQQRLARELAARERAAAPPPPAAETATTASETTGTAEPNAPVAPAPRPPTRRTE